MKKIIFSKEQIKNIIQLYDIDHLSTRAIGIKFNVDNGVIKRVLIENNTELRKSGRIFLGGKSESDKKYYQKNKKRRLLYISEWHKKNRKHLNIYHKKWRDENIDHHRLNKKNYERKRKSEDPIYKLIGNFRTAIYTVLKENNMSKCGHYFEILGYTPNELVNHLSSLLKDGMTWENYGEWHVDHKLPITSFIFKDANDPEFKKCWSLENLQPMWGPENISKSNHIL